MNILNSKKDINGSISILSSLSDSLNINNIIEKNDTSVNIFNNNSKDPISFLLKILISVVGVNVVKDILKSILIKELPNIDLLIKNVIKNSLIKSDDNTGLDGNLLVNGFDTPVKDIDYNKNFQGSGNNSMYLSNNTSNSLDAVMYKSIGNYGSNESFNGLNVKYNSSNDMMNIKPTSNTTKNQLLGNLIDNIQFLNKNVILVSIIDLLFGSIVSTLGKNKNDLLTDESFNKIIQKYVESEDETENLFYLSPEELNDISITIDNRLNNKLPLDFGCSDYNSFIDIETLNEILNSSDQIDALDNQVNTLLPQNPSLNNMDDLSPNKLNKVNKQINNNNKFTNNTATKDKVYNDLVSKIVQVIIKNSILSPQAILLQKLNYRIITGNNDISNGLDILKNQQNLFKCISQQVKDSITQIIFKRVKTEITNKVKPLAIAVATEKLANYEGLLASLVKIK